MVEALEKDGTTKMIRIGDVISPYSIATVELRMTTKEQAAHDQYYFPLVRRLRKPKGSTKEANPSDGLPAVGDKTPRVDMRALRRLTHLAFSSKLERLVARTGTSNLSDDISKWAGKYDKGASFLVAQTKQDDGLLVPQDRLGIAYYTAHEGPKLRYLARILRDVVVGKEQKLLIFVEKPMPLWQTEVFLDNLGMDVEVIRSQMDQEARAMAINRFNDPSSGCQILLTTFSCAASGLNLHEACYNVVVLEAPLNISTLLQAIGRVHRLGQLFPQKIWVLFCEHTFNRYIEWNNTRKFLPQLAGEHAAYLANKVRDTLGENCDP